MLLNSSARCESFDRYMEHTLIRSTRFVQEFDSHLRMVLGEALLLLFRAFIAQDVAPCESVRIPCWVSASLGNSLTKSRNLEVLWNGIENASVLSCDAGNNGSDIEGSGRASASSFSGTFSIEGMDRGEVLDRESGKTNVRSARC